MNKPRLHKTLGRNHLRPGEKEGKVGKSEAVTTCQNLSSADEFMIGASDARRQHVSAVHHRAVENAEAKSA